MTRRRVPSLYLWEHGYERFLVMGVFRTTYVLVERGRDIGGQPSINVVATGSSWSYDRAERAAYDAFVKHSADERARREVRR